MIPRWARTLALALVVLGWVGFVVLMTLHHPSSTPAAPTTTVSATAVTMTSTAVQAIAPQPPAPSPQPPAAGPNGSHTVSVLVSSGESLWELSTRYYGDPHQWPRIAAANHLANPNLILVGQRLEIP